jgi:hypothetical protein
MKVCMQGRAMRFWMAAVIITGLSGFSLAGSEISLSAGDPALWHPHKDGGNCSAVSAGPVVAGKPSVRFDYSNKRGYGNSRLDNLVIPAQSYGISFKILVEEATVGALMHIWLLEPDGDLWMCAIKPIDKKPIATVKGEWRQVFIPFSALNYQPRGDKKRNFLGINRMLMGFNNASQRVCVAGLSLNLRENWDKVVVSDKPLVPCTDPAGRRIAVLREPGFKKQPGHANPERLMKLLQESGFSPIFLSAADLSDRARFSRKGVDLLVIPVISGDFLRRGALIVLWGGMPLTIYVIIPVVDGKQGRSGLLQRILTTVNERPAF